MQVFHRFFYFIGIFVSELVCEEVSSYLMRSGVRDVDVSAGVDGEPVREVEEPLAPRGQHLARVGVQGHHGVLGHGGLVYALVLLVERPKDGNLVSGPLSVSGNESPLDN